jgi:protein phosphatase
MAQVIAYGDSQIGNVRKDNQDSIRVYEPDNDDVIRTHGYLYGIADGMGGYSHGEIASSVALQAFINNFYGGKPLKSPQNLRKAVQTANVAVYQEAQRLGMVRMGTTLSVVNIIGGELHIAHVGDSRVYQVRGRQSVCLTNDHTVVGELVRMRLLSPDKVRTHGQRSVLNRCLGIELFIQPDIYRFPVQADDYIILCTDGIWSVIQDDEFALIVSSIRQPDEINRTLIELALERESDDNVSAITVHIQQVTATQERTNRGFVQVVRDRFMGTFGRFIYEKV